MPEELARFHNFLRIMRSIDQHELVEAGVMAADNLSSWKRFQDDPYTWMLKADDDTVLKLWGIIERRSKK